MNSIEDILKVKRQEIEPQKGDLLISEPFMDNEYFKRSVILLVDHGVEGSMGFVLNKRLRISLDDVVEEIPNSTHIPIFLGGPMQQGELFFIHTLGDMIPQSVPIAEGLYFGGKDEVIQEYLLAGCPTEGKIKFFLGYAGWDSNQLKTEIEANSWAIGSDAVQPIFLATDKRYWRIVLKNLGADYHSWSYIPDNLNMN
ncbi:MAG: YqgE/AlgH family protein [Massilibacteroides sp.]|nr:YqgE/AlgH family protein [Massilibacteroides sp.]